MGFVGFVAGRLVAQSGAGGGRRCRRPCWGGVVAAVLLVALVSTGGDLGDSDAYGYAVLLRMMTVGGPLAAGVGTALALAVAAWTARRWRTA